MHKLIVLALILSIVACTAADSPEAQVRKSLAAMESAAEERDLGNFMRGVSEHYSDRDGRTAGDIERHVQGYFMLNQSIHLLSRIQSIQFPTTDSARAQLSVGMAGTGQRGGESTWNLATQVTDFDVTLVREGQAWRISYAEWQRAN